MGLGEHPKVILSAKRSPYAGLRLVGFCIVRLVTHKLKHKLRTLAFGKQPTYIQIMNTHYRPEHRKD